MKENKPKHFHSLSLHKYDLCRISLYPPTAAKVLIAVSEVSRCHHHNRIVSPQYSNQLLTRIILRSYWVGWSNQIMRNWGLQTHSFTGYGNSQQSIVTLFVKDYNTQVRLQDLNTTFLLAQAIWNGLSELLQLIKDSWEHANLQQMAVMSSSMLKTGL